MTDRELVLNAARAASIVGEYRTEHQWEEDAGGWTDRTALFYPDDEGWWNPLDDDGDALRLAVELGLLFSPALSRAHSELAAGVESDKQEVVRRAIVRAAAALAPSAVAVA